jgi:hypothetical protein
MTNRFKLTAQILALMSLLAFLPSSGGSQDQNQNPATTQNQGKKKKKKEDVVYVCACLQDRSCSCMTEAKMEGPCACGTQGGPPLKAVPKDSDWAKENRDAMAK